jgi:hypothetical protein
MAKSRKSHGMDELEAVAGDIAPCKALIARLRDSRVTINVNVKDHPNARSLGSISDTA